MSAWDRMVERRNLGAAEDGAKRQVLKLNPLAFCHQRAYGNHRYVVYSKGSIIGSGHSPTSAWESARRHVLVEVLTK